MSSVEAPRSLVGWTSYVKRGSSSVGGVIVRIPPGYCSQRLLSLYQGVALTVGYSRVEHGSR